MISSIHRSYDIMGFERIFFSFMICRLENLSEIQWPNWLGNTPKKLNKEIKFPLIEFYFWFNIPQ